ncbi:ABC-type nitrate/sulfonate/bicarbonate transport system ATPase subunit/ABC-type nitrate/sulfonate/bicarbonate transport system permease component [Parabacteroides sp. PF5-5]|uniref:ATP-binding cassette domain-containing protein n=1 Tax=unclassified Parabacteroides TaxID=2649774 RepID=UPI002476DCC3|nr:MULTISPECIES: ATP-binding cassette domain-containing protein [unclassified Parabacteroides]MDH6304694.1 ABC-type nitrate/sulfonate/bicarbonate transport system ATPase subunit/ABC-type nitrate/sulfonate/bicarbonate transport system permease component [Parabacteroides sp. PH5-39]MDH6315692.1 ABC-type nitrate/sulfonate/bicarbonate transport system ATPase subunit/ABC-type nitrate/sulfonate/bicarbonate transport system permease component [Parabacteroides sp. PF5-13]MDH6319352.1 ABC-type nitrate/su
MKKQLPALISIVFLLVVWQVAAQIINHPELFPSVLQSLQTLGLLFITPLFYQSLGATILRGLTGILFSLVLAGSFAVLFARYKYLYEAFRPILTLMRSIPVVSFILLALIYLHAESIPLIIAFLVMFPLLTENLTKGILHLKPAYTHMAQVFLITGKRRLLHIYYPQIKPFLFSGLSSALGFGWRAIIMGEVLAQCTWGIGSEMKRAQVFIEVPELLAWTIIAIVISFIFDKGIARLEKLRLPLSFPAIDREIPLIHSDIQMEDIAFSYNDKKVIDHFTFTFHSGKIYGVSAPSGAGKTTLLNLINGILIPDKGIFCIDRSRGIASLFQEPLLLPDLSVLENCLLPLSACYSKEKATGRVREILSRFQMEEYVDRMPDELSYGQQQRVAMVRALAFPSPFLLMDEPFKGLDKELIYIITDYIKARQQTKNQLLIFTSHKKEELELLADELIYFPK